LIHTDRARCLFSPRKETAKNNLGGCETSRYRAEQGCQGGESSTTAAAAAAAAADWMYFPASGDSGGRARTSSQHEHADDVVAAFPGIQQADGAGERREVGRGGDAEKVVGSSLAGDLNKLVIATSTTASSFCPAIITPTRAPSALGFDNPAALGAGCAAVGDSFLGFGAAAPSLEVWEERSAGGRERAPSSDNVDLGGGCDLGWGALDADDDIGSSRERGRGEEEADESYACDHDAEGR